MLQNLEFIQGFIEEARVHVDVVEAELLKMDVKAVDSESINNIFRAVHSVKGTAGFFNLTGIVELSHSMENIFGEFRAGKKQINEGMVDILLSANDCLKSMVENVMESENTDISGIKGRLSDIFSSGRAEPQGKKEVAAGINTESLKDVTISDAQKDKLNDDIKHGSSLYSVRLELNGDLLDKGLNPVQFSGSIRTIGSIIKCSADFNGIYGEAAVAEDIIFTYMLTSVLEKDLLADALNIPQECITRVDWDIQASDAVVSAHEDRDASAGVEEPAHSQDVKAGEPGIEKNRSISVEDSVRVHVTLLNNLLNLASEMVLGRNQLLRAMENHRKAISGIEPILQNIDHITTEMQEKIMQTRMQPIANVFNKFPRIIRELSKKLGKEVELRLEGVDVELDKSIIEALGDPLTHLARNAADHGLELPADREKAGKSRTGTIVMKAYHEGGYVNIDVVDDGKGIDIEVIKKKALEKDLINKADAPSMSEQEVLQLLFKPGFSTAEKVTDVSGRGVGMDVVKTNIEKLGGSIEIFTLPGKGTTFRLLLPLTLAIISSLIVEVENQKFALPQVNLQEIVRIKPGDASRRIEYINNAEVLRLRGRLLPIVHLADVIGIKRSYVDPKTGEVMEERRKTLFDSRRAVNSGFDPGTATVVNSRKEDYTNILRILVIKIGSRRLGIAVNAIHESEEILVKPLPVHIKNCKCYSGVTILGDGKTVMILDPGGIIEKANLRFLEGQDEKKLSELSDEVERVREQQNLILFKCSGPETLAIDLSMVSRVEEISPEMIEKIGDREYIKFRGDTLRVIRPEDFLPINRQQTSRNKMYVIIPKLVNRKIGILIEAIHDTIQSSIHLKQDDICTKGLIGSTILSDRIVLLVNIYELFEKADPEYFSVKSSVKSGERITILIAEDTPFFLTLEKNYLEGAGFQVMTAQNGKEALEVLQNNTIDAVVSDINMPVMDGLELVRRIRGDSRLAGLPVIALTSLTGESQKKCGLEAGFDAYEFKLDRVRLLEILEQAIKKRGK